MVSKHIFLAVTEISRQHAAAASIASVAFLGLLYYIWGASQPRGVEAPYGIPYQRYLPRWIAGLIYAGNAMEMIERSHKKYPDTPFKIVRTDAEITFLPSENIVELSSLSHDIASNVGALTHDLVAHWSGLHLPIGSLLHYRVIQRKMVSPPSLESIAPSLEDEINRTVEQFFPEAGEGWVAVRPFDLFQTISSRLSSRTLVGLTLSRDQSWEDFCYRYTEDLFKSVITMRLFPPLTWPILHYILPSCLRTQRKVDKAEALLGPYFDKALESTEDEKEVEGDMTEPNGFRWCVQMARGIERDGVKIAQCQTALALGAIHTTFVSNINILYDLIANPEYMDILRDEITEVNKAGWDSTSYSKLGKLDSVLRESLRMNPPQMIGIRRKMQQDYELKSGVFLPKGSYVCVATHTVQNDPERNSDPENFDGLRSYKKRMESKKSVGYRYTDTDSSSLGFGYFKTACPGRWFASISMKALFVKILSEFDFKFENGQRTRPENVIIHEINFPNPYHTLLVRRRENRDAPF